jgi:hypothetical protein
MYNAKDVKVYFNGEVLEGYDGPEVTLSVDAYEEGYRHKLKHPLTGRGFEMTAERDLSGELDEFSPTLLDDVLHFDNIYTFEKVLSKLNRAVTDTLQ